MSLRYIFLLLLAPPTLGQLPRATVPSGTPLAIGLDRAAPLRPGAPLQGRLLYPIYVNNVLVLPEGTTVLGTVQALQPDRSRRTRAMLGGDFTPFRTPVVRFESLRLPDGASVSLTATETAAGAPVYRAVAPERAHGGLIHRQFKAALDAGRSDLAYFIAPGKRTRLLDWVYSQLPYHPQSIAAGTAWTVELTAPAQIPLRPLVAAPAVPQRRPHFWEVQPIPPEQPQPGVWRVEANLAESISSESAARGHAVRAVVARPVLNSDHTVALPEGATLVGSITQARPARWFGRSGVLTFSFNQIILPGQPTQTVETRLTGADSATDIALNSEGQVKSRPRDRVAIPLLLAVMASSPLDQDEGHAHHTGRKNATGGAAGLGLIGTVVGAAGGSPYVAAGIGYWGLARSVWGRWIARGQKIAFPKDTRVVIETVPRQSSPIHPNPER